MRLNQFSQGFELTAAIAAHVDSRVQLALATAGDQIDTVTVRLADINGSRGGEDKRCRIVVSLRNSSRTVVVDATHADLYTAVDDATAAAKEAVWRGLQRRRTLLRDQAGRHRRLLA